MGKTIQNEYNPDFVSPPGDTLEEVLGEIGMTQAELAKRTGRRTKTINEIIKGKAPITPDTAIRLERVLGVSASFWNSRERQYREKIAECEEKKRLQKDTEWIKIFPYKAMIKFGWIEKDEDAIQQVKAFLNFFAIATPEDYTELNFEVAFRKSNAFDYDYNAIKAWLRKGEIDAKNIQAEPYNRKKLKDTLYSIRDLTVLKPEHFIPEIIHLCAECGLVVVFIKELPKTRIYGATRWLTPDKPLIQLSLRYKRDDHLWFTLFHEIGHIIKHGKKKSFIEFDGNCNNDNDEQEANSFASNLLIPNSAYNSFLSKRRFNRKSIRDFAEKINIAPGIVVGRLQHDNHLKMNYLNNLKQEINWEKMDAILV